MGRVLIPEEGVVIDGVTGREEVNELGGHAGGESKDRGKSACGGKGNLAGSDSSVGSPKLVNVGGTLWFRRENTSWMPGKVCGLESLP